MLPEALRVDNSILSLLHLTEYIFNDVRNDVDQVNLRSLGEGDRAPQTLEGSGLDAVFVQGSRMSCDCRRQTGY